MELKVQHLTRSFHTTKAVQNVSFTLHEGIHALLGANGSGKTTLLKMITGTLAPSKGIITWDHIKIDDQYEWYCSGLGYLPQHFGYYPNYTIEEFLLYLGQLKKIRRPLCKKRIDLLLTQLNLNEFKKRKMKTLSGGMLQRVGIAQALLQEPKILILDEPTAGLDPKERIVFHNLLASLSSYCVILLSTHIVSDIESIADDILVMKEGKLLAHANQKQLLESMKQKVWILEANRYEAKELLRNYIVVHTQKEGELYRLRIASDTKPYSLAQPCTPTLDDYYLYHFAKGGESHDILNTYGNQKDI